MSSLGSTPQSSICVCRDELSPWPMRLIFFFLINKCFLNDGTMSPSYNHPCIDPKQTNAMLKYVLPLQIIMRMTETNHYKTSVIIFPYMSSHHLCVATSWVTNRAPAWVRSIGGGHHLGVIKVWWGMCLLTDRNAVCTTHCPSDTERYFKAV